MITELADVFHIWNRLKRNWLSDYVGEK